MLAKLYVVCLASVMLILAALIGAARSQTLTTANTVGDVSNRTAIGTVGISSANDNRNTVGTNQQSQHQGQSQRAIALSQGSQASGMATSGSVAGQNSVTLHEQAAAAGAYAPTVINPNCSKSVTLGTQAMVGGASLGWNRFDVPCQLGTMGRADVAFEVLCEDHPEVRAAALRLAQLGRGVPCAADTAPPAPAPAPVPVTVPAPPSYCQPLRPGAPLAERLNRAANCPD